MRRVEEIEFRDWVVLSKGVRVWGLKFKFRVLQVCGLDLRVQG